MRPAPWTFFAEHLALIGGVVAIQAWLTRFNWNRYISVGLISYGALAALALLLAAAVSRRRPVLGANLLRYSLYGVLPGYLAVFGHACAGVVLGVSIIPFSPANPTWWIVAVAGLIAGTWSFSLASRSLLVAREIEADQWSLTESKLRVGPAAP